MTVMLDTLRFNVINSCVGCWLSIHLNSTLFILKRRSCYDLLNLCVVSYQCAHLNNVQRELRCHGQSFTSVCVLGISRWVYVHRPVQRRFKNRSHIQICLPIPALQNDHRNIFGAKKPRYTTILLAPEKGFDEPLTVLQLHPSLILFNSINGLLGSARAIFYVYLRDCVRFLSSVPFFQRELCTGEY